MYTPEWVAGVLAAASADPCSAQVRGALRDVLAHGLLRRLLEEIVTDHESLTVVTARSFPHPNGFAKFVLAQSANGAKVRVHCWAERELYDADIHDHFWDYSSVLLTGVLRSDTFAVTDGEAYHRYRLTRLGPHRYEQDYLGRCNAERTSSTRLEAGYVSSVRYRVLHTIAPADGGYAATLVCQGAPVASTNNIISKTPPATDHKIVVERPFTLADTRGRLRELLERLPE